MTELPIFDVLEPLQAALAAGSGAVLLAPPGAGKTTVVPLALLDAPWLAGRRILMLEPRRLAARAAAARLAATRGERVGQTVGYRMRQDTRVSAATRIEVVTEGVLTRMLQQDPSLPDVGIVIFDEFHERSLQADLGLAFCLETQGALREDLRLLVMSATLDAAPVADLLGVPVIACEGRMYPVTTRHAEQPIDGDPAPAVARAVRRALAEETGSVLVFLPGQAEIHRVNSHLTAASLPADVTVCPLFGDLDSARQDAAIQPAPAGTRKVVLATAIAETSLTIEGVRVVVDSGLARYPLFDPVSGMSRLVTRPVSVAAADQRRGRAGRLEPGICYRLWTAADHTRLPAQQPPEILGADLAPLALELASWGVRDAADLAWLDPPPAATLAQARELLTELSALDAGGGITAHGRRLLALPLHPRLGHMLQRAHEAGQGPLACDIAALLSERDVVEAQAGYRDVDLRLRVEALHGRFEMPGLSVHRGRLQRVKQAAADLRRRLRIDAGRVDADATGRVLALAYPDRVAQGRGDSAGRFRLRNGRGAVLDAPQALAREPFLAIADLDGTARESRVFLAAPVSAEAIAELFAEQIESVDSVAWDSRSAAVLARRQRRLGAVVLHDAPLPDPDPTDRLAAMLDGVRQLGLAALPWSKDAAQLRQRVNFCHRHAPDHWPDWSDNALLANADTWLGPWLDGINRRDDLRRLDLLTALRNTLGWNALRDLDRLAPTHLTVPSGSSIRLDYDSDPPVLAVKLQEMFGCRQTPALLDGRVPLLIHLLSPARRPVQVTQDLASFWATTYEQVRKDLRGRYPKHPWPDDPLAAPPTRRAKPRGT